jgi:hypothetical protein
MRGDFDPLSAAPSDNACIQNANPWINQLPAYRP